MMKPIFLLLFNLIFYTISVYSQNSSCDTLFPIQFYIDETDNPLITYAPFHSLQDTIIEHSNIGTSIIKILLKNCTGEAIIWKYRGNSLLIQGQYVSSIDTLKEYATKFNLQGDALGIIVSKYFEPLKDGLWVYYKKNGKLLRKEQWSNGIKLK